MELKIQWMFRKDLPQVIKIEQASFETAWDQDDFLACLSTRNNVGLVAVHEGKVVGFVVYEIHKYTFRLTNFAVHPDWRRQGVGTQMMAHIVGKLSIYKYRHRITLEVRDTNLAAQLFFQRCWFQAAGILPRFFEDGEDGYLFEYDTLEKPEVIQEQEENLLVCQP